MKNSNIDYQSISKGYDKIADQIQHGSEIYERITNILFNSSNISNDDVILDAACGNGGLSFAINKKLSSKGLDPSLYGFDISSKEVETAAKLNPGSKITVQHLPKLSYPDNYFSVIVCSSAFEHMLEPLASLKELKRILKNNAYLFLSIPNGDRAGLNKYYRERKAFQPNDDYFYTFGEFQHVARKAGLRIVDYWGWGKMEPTLVKGSIFNKIKLLILNVILLSINWDVDRHRKMIMYKLQIDDNLSLVDY